MGQILVGGGDDPHIHLQGLFPSHPLEASLLKEPQKHDLSRGADLANFVQEDGSGMGQLKPSPLLFHRSRERTLLVAEQLAVQHPFRVDGTVGLDEGPIAALAVVMDDAGDQSLPRAALSLNENRRI